MRVTNRDLGGPKVVPLESLPISLHAVCMRAVHSCRGGVPCPYIFFSILYSSENGEAMCDMGRIRYNCLEREAAYSDEDPVTSSFPPFLKEHLHSRNPPVMTFL